MEWILDVPNKAWWTFRVVSAIVLLGFFAYILFKLTYEREYGAIRGGY